MNGGFRERALSAVKWSVSGDIAEQGIRLIFSVALARLLAPRDFGLILMVTAVTQIAGLFTELGLGEALVQRGELTEAHRSSVFWVLLLAATTLTVAQIAGATAIASLYGVHELVPLAQVLSALFILDAIGWVPRALMARQLAFRITARLQCITALLAGGSAVALAWYGFGVMSLVGDLLLTSGLESLLLWRASGWRPRLEVRGAALRDLLGFSVNRLGARLLTVSAAPIDRLLIGKYLGSGPLGLYVRAFNVTRLPVVNISRSIGRAMFPSLALIQHDVRAIGDVYLRTVPAVAVATFPMCLGLFATAEPLIIGVLGVPWHDAVPIVRALSIAALIQSVSLLTSCVYLSCGRADFQLRLAGVERVSAIAAIAIGLRWGLLGAATSYVFAVVLTALPTFYFANRLVDLRQRVMLIRLWPIFVAAAAMTAVVLTVDGYMAARIGMSQRLGLDVSLGILVYYAGLRLLRVPAYADVMSLLQRAA